jgi:SAM-dependent methyltransferase
LRAAVGGLCRYASALQSLGSAFGWRSPARPFASASSPNAARWKVSQYQLRRSDGRDCPTRERPVWFIDLVHARGLRGALKRGVGFEGRYSLWEPAYLYIHQERERAILRLLGRHGFRPLTDAKVLEIGCGTGAVLRDFLRFGVQPANAVGIDIDSDALAIARARNPGIDFRTADAAELPNSDESFDLVLAFTLFTSIPDGSK